MKHECSIVRDLLALYAEDMVSPDTASFVRDHLNSCPECRALYENEKMPELPQDSAELPLKQLKKKMTLRRVQAIVLTAVTVAVLLISVFAVLDAPEYLPYSPELLTLTENPDGSICIRFSDRVTDYRYTTDSDESLPGKVCGTLEAWTSKWDRKISARGIQTLTLDSLPERIYYCSNNGQDDTLIWGSTPEYSGKVSLPRLIPGYYCVLAFGLLLVLLIMRLALRRHPKAAVWTERLALFPPAYLLAHLLIMGTDFISYSAQRDLGLISIVTVCLYLGFLTVHHRLRLSREVKNMAQ